MVVWIGRKPFYSKEDALKYFSEKLRGMKGKGVFWDDEVYELFKHHPLFHEKTRGLRVKGFIVEDSSKPSYFTVYAVLENDEKVDFSYRKCVEVAFDPSAWRQIQRRNRINAFRRAVEDQVYSFRDSRRLGEWLILDDHTLAKPDEAHAHHETPFMKILEEFLKEKGLTLEQVEIREADDGKGYELADEKLREEWREFHREKTKLRLLRIEEHYKQHKQAQTTP